MEVCGGLCIAWCLFCVLACFVQACGRTYRKKIREPAKLKAVLLKAAKSKRDADAKDALARRLEQARDAKILECQLFFSLHRPELEPRYTADMFREHVDSYLRTAPGVADVERRAAQLLAHLQAHLRASGGAGESENVGELHGWFTARKAEIEGLDVPQDIREALIARLQVNYVDRLQRTLGDP